MIQTTITDYIDKNFTLLAKSKDGFYENIKNPIYDDVAEDISKTYKKYFPEGVSYWYSIYSENDSAFCLIDNKTDKNIIEIHDEKYHPISTTQIVIKFTKEYLNNLD